MGACLALAEADTHTSALAWFGMPVTDLTEWVEAVSDRQKEREKKRG